MLCNKRVVHTLVFVALTSTGKVREKEREYV